MSDLDDNQREAIAILARGLQGALQHARAGGIEHLPRPGFPVLPEHAAPRPPAAAAPRSHPTAVAPAPAAASLTPTPPVPAVRPARAVLPVVAPAIQGSAAESIAAILASGASNGEKLERLRADVIGECTRCKLHRGRARLVFGVGNANAALVFVGEGPGADEDRQGVPFVGKAGQLLTKMIEAMGFARDDVYICNVVKCRPPSNRDPEPDEVEACEPFLQAQLAILNPLAIVALGRHAAQTLLRTKTPITRLRGSWQEYGGVPLMPTYHPSYLLREESDPERKRKREAWNDLQEVMKVFGKERAH